MDFYFLNNILLHKVDPGISVDLGISFKLPYKDCATLSLTNTFILSTTVGDPLISFMKLVNWLGNLERRSMGGGAAISAASYTAALHGKPLSRRHLFHRKLLSQMPSRLNQGGRNASLIPFLFQYRPHQHFLFQVNVGHERLEPTKRETSHFRPKVWAPRLSALRPSAGEWTKRETSPSRNNRPWATTTDNWRSIATYSTNTCRDNTFADV